jgi:hypothetical protein
MKLQGQLAVGSLDLGLGRIVCHAQGLVVIVRHY